MSKLRAVAATILLLGTLAGCLDASPQSPAPQEPTVQWWETQASPEGVSASEVSIAVSPVDPSYIVAAANSQGRFGLYVSHDAGATWEAQLVGPDVLGPTGSAYLFLSDPAVAFAPDGTPYIAGLAYVPASSVFVIHSRDGGASWQGNAVWTSDVGTTFNDKEWLGIHPETGTLIVAWQREPAMDMLRDNVDKPTGVDADVGQIVWSRSTNGGESWSLPVEVSRGLHNNGTQVAFTPDGRAHMMWVNYEQKTLDWVVSGDDGQTWTAPQAIVDINIVGSYDRHPRMHTLPALVASPVSNSLYAIWHDDRHGDADAMVVASHDGGATWGDAMRVPDDAIGSGAIQFYPWGTVDTSDTLWVGYYSSAADSHPRFAYHVVSYNGTWGTPEVASSQPFTVFVGPNGETDEARSIGDYTGLASHGLDVYAAWADGRADVSGIWVAKRTTAP